MNISTTKNIKVEIDGGDSIVIESSVWHNITEEEKDSGIIQSNAMETFQTVEISQRDESSPLVIEIDGKKEDVKIIFKRK